MAMDFPNSPAVNDTFTVGDKTWKWTGSVWEIVASRPPMRTASDTPPASPIPSDEWFNSLTGRTYIWYDNYWIEQNTNSVVGASGLNGVASASAPLVYNSTNNNISVQNDPKFTGRIRMTGTSSDTSGVLELQSFDNALNYIYKSNGGGLNFTTQAGVAMAIDQSGRVTKPFQPTFAASSAQSTTQGNDIIWDQYISQVGTSYNSSNGRFTAPVSGYYYFHAHGLWGNADSGDRRVGLYKNGAGFSGMRFITNKAANVWHTWFIDGVVYMAVGDYATVRVEQSGAGMHTDANYNQFSGYLLG